MKKLLLFLAVAGVFTCAAQTEKEKVVETITQSDIEGHIYFLADDLLKGRQTGTPELKIAASYLANTLRSYGVKPNPKTGTYYQEVPFNRVTPPKEASIVLNDQDIKDFVFIDAAAVNSNEDALFLNYGLEEDYAGKDVKGKVIVVNAGSAETKDTRAAFGLRRTKQKLAQDNGVLAVIELLNADENMWGFIDHNFNEPRLELVEGKSDEPEDPFAYVWVLDKDGKMSESLSTSSTISSKIAIGNKIEEPVMSQNVIGVVEGTDPQLKDQYIIYSAH